MNFGGSISWHLLYRTISCRLQYNGVCNVMYVVCSFILLSCFTPSYFIFYEILSPHKEIACSTQFSATKIEMCACVCVSV